MQDKQSYEEWKASQPHLKEFFPYLETAKSESARGKVLVSTGFLEERLKQMLLAFFVADSRSATELVAGANAPLGTFSSRIGACSALGLITETEAHDLTLIRRIRNDFAHDIHTSFETRSVIERCKLLKLKAHDYIGENMGEVIIPACGQFETASVSLIMNFTNRPHYVQQQRRKAGGWPY